MSTRAALLSTLLLLACTAPDNGDAPVGGDGGMAGDGGDAGLNDGGSDDDGGSTSDGGTQSDSPFSGLVTTVDPDIQSLVRLSWDQEEGGDTQVVYSVDPGEWLRSPMKAREAGAHEELLLGVPFGTTVTARLEVELDGKMVRSEEVTASTGALPEGLPVPIVRISEETLQDSATPWILVSTTTDGGGWGNPWWVFIVDRKGRVVWAWQSPEQRVAMFAQPSFAGDSLLVDLDSYWGAFDLGLESEVVELTLDGQQHRQWDAVGLHHSFTELPDGSIAWGAHDGIEETLQIKDAEGVRRQIWSCADYVESSGPSECISNTVFYDEEEDRFLVSLVSHDTIVAIDRDSGALQDSMGKLATTWLTMPTNEGFAKQHDAEITAEGTLLMSSDGDFGREETVVREYRINPTTQTLEQIWSYGDGENLWAQRLGNAQRLPGGNTQHGIGSTGRLREITPEGQLALELDFSFENDLGRTTALGDLYDFVD